MFILLQYELLFCVQNSQDADVIKLVNDLKSKYPHVDAQIFVGELMLYW